MLLPLLGVSLIVFGQDVFDAVKKGDAALVRSLLEGDKELVKARDADGRTPLHWAARARPANPDLMALLIGNGADVNARDNDRSAPLHDAAGRAQDGAVALLLARGADPNAEDNGQKTPLQLAAAALPFGFAVPAERKETVRLLVEAGAEMPLSGEDARKLLHAAASGGYRELAEKMLAKGADWRTLNGDGGTLLHSAAAGGLVGLIDLLVRRGLDANGRSRYGLTPLHVAAMAGRSAAAERLLAGGADLHVRCPAGRTPWNDASEGGFRELAAMLAAKGADQGPPRFPLLRGPYLGQRRPGRDAELFAPGLLSSMRMEHGPAVFSPDGREVYWTSVVGGQGRIFTMKIEAGRWTAPRALTLSGFKNEEMPTLSPDGRSIYFNVESPDGSRQYHLWVCRRRKRNWGKALPIGPPVDTGRENSQPAVTRDGTLYFSSQREGGQGGSDLYRSRFVNGRYLPAENLGPAVNSPGTEIHPFAAPDGSYLLFTSDRPGGWGGYDLYVTFPDKDGGWIPAVNLGERINGRGTINWLGAVTPDGNYLFFASNRNGNPLDIWWADAGTIEGLRPKR